MIRHLLLAWVTLCIALPAWAHKPSDAYLRLEPEEVAVQGRWDIALRDLEHAIGLDADNDGQLTWDEVRTRHVDIAAYALSRLRIERGGRPCRLQAGEQLIDRHTDGAYTVLPFRVDCEAGGALAIGYRLFADIDPQHRGLVGIGRGAAVQTLVLGGDEAQASIELENAPRAGFLNYVRHGVWHIWIGFDHILFLLSLLLPAVLAWRAGGWQPVSSLRLALVDVVKVVSAFTVAHSITLSLAALGIVSLPTRWVETAIAASVILAALNNVVPLTHSRRWLAAFVFGLLHGFGFASVLGDLGLPPSALASALLGFNAGVELGQLAIVAAFLPISYALRATRFYRRVVLAGGSSAIILVAAFWFTERAFDLRLLPG
ncbi:HupE/UreJ family protein [Massilia sp. DD77]|uniref:HupE/UreJ family protein n=1 Tax=Massilia sp. DD77 TaxID=3109349 RepID=UPI002FFDF1FC